MTLPAGCVVRVRPGDDDGRDRDHRRHDHGDLQRRQPEDDGHGDAAATARSP